LGKVVRFQLIYIHACGDLVTFLICTVPKDPVFSRGLSIFDQRFNFLTQQIKNRNIYPASQWNAVVYRDIKKNAFKFL